MSETRHQFLKKTLQKRISEMAPGSRIPSENELCVEFQVSRMTVNKVVCELEKAGLVIRRRHYGTFVREFSVQPRIVTFLMPCPDNLTSNNFSSSYRRELLSGVMEAVRTAGARLETITVSPTNDINDIDLPSLKHLTSDSLVIVTGTWYAKLFGILHQYGCRVCFLDDQVLYSYTEEKKYTENWLIGDMDVKTAIHDLTLRLHKQGANRIAIMSPYLQYPGHARTEGYREALQEIGLPELYYIQDSPMRQKLTDLEVNFLKLNNCDGVILDTSDLTGIVADTLNQALGLPESIHIGTMYFRPEINFCQQTPLSFKYDYKKIGYDSVIRLLADNSEPRYVTYPPIFIEEP